jgi:hypothetical protein
MSEILISLTIGLAAAAATVVGTELWQDRRARRLLVVDLFREYTSPAMVEAWTETIRGVTAEAARSGGPRPWGAIWKSEARTDNEFYAAAAQIVNFFWQVDLLHGDGAIDSQMAKRHFGYQFASWATMFEPVVEATNNSSDWERPVWLDTFLEWRSNWIVADLTESDWRRRDRSEMPGPR